MRFSNNFPLSCFWKPKYISAVVFLVMSSLVWAETLEGADVAKPEIVAASMADISQEPEKKMFNEEAREMPGIVFGSIIVNGVLLVVFFWLLWRELQKHKRKPKPELNNKSEEQL